MSTRPSERSKVLAKRLAQVLTVQIADDEEVWALLLNLGYGRAEQVEEKPLPAGHSGHIGIYKPEIRESGVYYVRDISQKDRWSWCADVQTIPPKSDKKRVVLLGESVARGFLFDPDYTPCLLLQKLLDSNTADIPFEVIDLAETNMMMRGLLERCTECMQLVPDVIVFLAGNNWRGDLEESFYYDSNSYKYFENADAEAGVSVYRGILEARMERMVSSFFREIGKLKEQHNFQAIFAIPEFNLLDCRSTPGERYVSMLKGENVMRWLSARDRAQKAFEAKDYVNCEVAAQEMTNLDTSHPFGFELLADCMLQKRETEKAREYLEKARDTALFCRTNSKPRIFNVTRKAIREAALQHGIRVIEVAEVLKAHLKGGIPGRDMFLDYCHFSMEGMQVAMASVVNAVLDIVTAGKAKAGRDVFTIRPKQEAHALAHLFAAIHNAHWGQHYEIMKFHCEKALRYHSPVAKMMIYYCEMINRVAPNNLCKSFELLVRDSRLDKYLHALVHPRNGKSMELELVDAMMSSLVPMGINLSFFIEEIRLRDHSLNGQKVDLLRTYYHLSSWDAFQGSKTSFYQARDNISLFHFVHDGKSGISLKLCCRVPGDDNESAYLYLFVNEKMVCQVDVSNRWTMHEIVVSEEICVKSLNVVKLVWPIKGSYTQMQNLSTKRRGSASILDASFVVLGEISSFFATKRPPYLSAV